MLEPAHLLTHEKPFVLAGKDRSRDRSFPARTAWFMAVGSALRPDAASPLSVLSSAELDEFTT